MKFSDCEFEMSRDDARFPRHLFTVLSNRADGTHPLVRNGRGRREALEKAALGERTCDQCDGARIHEEVAGDFSSEDGSTREQRDPDAGGNGYKVRGAPKQGVRKQLEVEKDCVTCSPSRLNIRVSRTKSKHLDTDELDGTSGQGLGDHEDSEGGDEQYSSGDLVGLKRGKMSARKRAVPLILLPMRTVETHGQEL